ncbi:hypothetical protein BDZ89DRAFT_1034265 [Hymenopellis radicata]|nr:hypothetical protein BDZ89DRAFT_1034265 [Hymenopellis radicata]
MTHSRSFAFWQLEFRFIEVNFLTADDRDNVRAYQRRHQFTTAATHVLDTPFNPTEAEKAWWLGKYNAHRERQNRITINRSFLKEVSAIECIVINRLRAEKRKRAERARRAEELERAVISSKRPLPLDDDSDEAERNAKRHRLNNGAFSTEEPRLDPRQLNKCRFDVVEDAVKLCDCKSSCTRMKRSYYYNIALEKVPIVYPVIIPQPTKGQPKAAAVTLLLEGTTDDIVDGVAVNAKNPPSVDEPRPEPNGPSFAKVYMKRTAAAFTRKDARSRMEWRTQGRKSAERKRMGSALKCELKLAPSKLNSEDTIIVDRTNAGRRGLDYMQPTLENI